MSELERKVAEIRTEMCCAQHPVLGILCMRNPGHDGQHWAQHRWTDESALEQLERFKDEYDARELGSSA